MGKFFINSKALCDLLICICIYVCIDVLMYIGICACMYIERQKENESRESLRMHLISGFFFFFYDRVSLSPHKRVLNLKFLSLFWDSAPTSLGMAVFQCPHTSSLWFCPLSREVLFLVSYDFPWASRLTVPGEQRLCLPCCQISRTSTGLIHREYSTNICEMDKHSRTLSSPIYYDSASLPHSWGNCYSNISQETRTFINFFHIRVNDVNIETTETL